MPTDGINVDGSYLSQNKVVVTVPSTATSQSTKVELKNAATGEVYTTITVNFVYEDVQNFDYKEVSYDLRALTNGSDVVGNIANAAGTIKATPDATAEAAGITASVAGNGDVTVNTAAKTTVGTYNITLSGSGFNSKVVSVTVAKADVALADSGSKLGNIKVSAKVGGAAIALDNTSALSVQVAKAGTTDKVDVKGTWSYDSAKGLWRFAPAADAGLVAGDTLYISLAEGANYNAAGPVVVNLAE